MLLDADKPAPPRPPTDWRWPSQWPWLLQASPLLIVWVLELMARYVHPYWEHAAFACVTIWLLWSSWDAASNPDNPYQVGRSKRRRTIDAAIGVALWLGLASWYLWSLVAVHLPAAN